MIKGAVLVNASHVKEPNIGKNEKNFGYVHFENGLIYNSGGSHDERLAFDRVYASNFCEESFFEDAIMSSSELAFKGEHISLVHLTASPDCFGNEWSFENNNSQHCAMLMNAIKACISHLKKDQCIILTWFSCIADSRASQCYDVLKDLSELDNSILSPVELRPVDGTPWDAPDDLTELVIDSIKGLETILGQAKSQSSSVINQIRQSSSKESLFERQKSSLNEQSISSNGYFPEYDVITLNVVSESDNSLPPIGSLRFIIHSMSNPPVDSPKKFSNNALESLKAFTQTLSSPCVEFSPNSFRELLTCPLIRLGAPGFIGISRCILAVRIIGAVILPSPSSALWNKQKPPKHKCAFGPVAFIPEQINIVRTVADLLNTCQNAETRIINQIVTSLKNLTATLPDGSTLLSSKIKNYGAAAPNSASLSIMNMNNYENHQGNHTTDIQIHGIEPQPSPMPCTLTPIPHQPSDLISMNDEDERANYSIGLSSSSSVSSATGLNKKKITHGTLSSSQTINSTTAVPINISKHQKVTPKAGMASITPPRAPSYGAMSNSGTYTGNTSSNGILTHNAIKVLELESHLMDSNKNLTDAKGTIGRMTQILQERNRSVNDLKKRLGDMEIKFEKQEKDSQILIENLKSKIKEERRKFDSQFRHQQSVQNATAKELADVMDVNKHQNEKIEELQALVKTLQQTVKLVDERARLAKEESHILNKRIEMRVQAETAKGFSTPIPTKSPVPVKSPISRSKLILENSNRMHSTNQEIIVKKLVSSPSLDNTKVDHLNLNEAEFHSENIHENFSSPTNHINYNSNSILGNGKTMPAQRSGAKLIMGLDAWHENGLNGDKH